MAGLARMQQKFNAAIVAVLALAGLRNMAGAAQSAADAARVGYGHPVHAKYLRANPMRHNRPGTTYQGYCSNFTNYFERKGATLRRVVPINNALPKAGW